MIAGTSHIDGVLGDVRTIDSASSTARAVSISDGRVSGVAGADPRGRVLDFGGRVVMPAFVDPHAHTEVSSLALSTMVDCRVPRCRTVADVLDALRDGLRDFPTGQGYWLTAQANLFFNQKLADGRYPTKEELDSVSRTVPIIIHAGGHTSLLNSAAIEVSDLGRFTGNAAGAMGGAIVEIGSDGTPTGLVSEIDSMLPIVAPPFDMADVLQTGVEQMFTRFGVSVVGDIAGSIDGVQAYAGLVADGRIPQRVLTFLCAPGTVSFEDAFRGDDNLERPSDRFRVAGVKVFADGGFSSKNAATWVAYRKEVAIRPGSRGRINLTSARVATLVREAAQAGLDLAVHGNGERAQDAIIRGVLKSGVRNGPRVRIEHLGNLLTRPEAVDAWLESGVIPMPQPGFLYNFGDYFPVYLGKTAERGRFPFKSLHARGLELNGSSDVYTGAEERQTNPFFGMWCSLKRTSFSGAVIEAEEAIDLDTAVRMHTINAARSLGLGDQYGSVEVGKQADLIVLDRDPWKTDAADLPDIKVDHMIVGGRLAYSREGAESPSVT
ncbi:amidohydrolase [Microbacterium atlanticum]|uniref:amidohydrolase n=1 Tax=Microbacterium atlanticum TaxID=2782168 RepID=UPI001889BA7D|nr:amidohydrolase family protein [Microbacterium atlanticum]